MTEFSMLPWETQTGTGDGVFSYNQNQANDFFRYFDLQDVTVQGIGVGVLNELAVSSPDPNTIDVDSGVAVCYGRYWNDATVSFAVADDVIIRGYRVVLQADWATNTIRLALLSSGSAAIPSVTQTAGTLWEISLATFTKASGLAGAIVLTDDRTYLQSVRTVGNANMLPDAVDTVNIVDLAVTTAKIDDLAVTTAKLDNLAVTTAKIDDLAVTNAKLGDLSVSTGKIQDSAVTAIKIADRTRSIWIPALVGFDQLPSVGAPTYIQASSGYNVPIATIDLPTAADNTAASNGMIPHDWVTAGAATLYTIAYIDAGQPAGVPVENVVVNTFLLSLGICGAGTIGGGVNLFTVYPIPNPPTSIAYCIQSIPIPPGTFTNLTDGGNIFQVSTQRVGTNVSDTYIHPLQILGWRIEYTADS